MCARGRSLVLLVLGSMSCVGLPPAPAPADGSGTTSTGTTASPMTTGGPGVSSGVATQVSTPVTSDDGSSSVGTTDAPADLPDFERACDLQAQDCPEGDKCMPWANDGGTVWNATRCTPLDANPSQPGDDCMVVGSSTSGADTCDIGGMCWDVDPRTNTGICETLCVADLPCRDPDTACVSVVQGLLTLCLPLCDPLLQDCIGGQGCYPSPESDFACYPDTSGTSGAAGSPCEALYDCDPGSICVAASRVTGCMDPSCCAWICDLSDPMAACPTGTECTPFYDVPPPGLEDVGVCITSM